MRLQPEVRMAIPFFRIAAMTLGFLAAFALTILVLSGTIGLLRGTGILDHIAVAVICTLAIWVIVARILIRDHSISLKCQDRDTFSQSVQNHLSEMGYELAKESDNSITFKPAFHSRLFGGNITVQHEESGVIATGPKIYLEGLEKRLRNERFLGPLQKSLAMAKKPTP